MTAAKPSDGPDSLADEGQVTEMVVNEVPGYMKDEVSEEVDSTGDMEAQGCRELGSWVNLCLPTPPWLEGAPLLGRVAVCHVILFLRRTSHTYLLPPPPARCAAAACIWHVCSAGLRRLDGELLLGHFC